MSEKNSSEHNDVEQYNENEDKESDILKKKNFKEYETQNQEEEENDENVNENLKNINKSRSLISPTE